MPAWFLAPSDVPSSKLPVTVLGRGEAIGFPQRGSRWFDQAGGRPWPTCGRLGLRLASKTHGRIPFEQLAGNTILSIVIVPCSWVRGASKGPEGLAELRCGPSCLRFCAERQPPSVSDRQTSRGPPQVCQELDDDKATNLISRLGLGGDHGCGQGLGSIGVCRSGGCCAARKVFGLPHRVGRWGLGWARVGSWVGGRDDWRAMVGLG